MQREREGFGALASYFFYFLIFAVFVYAPLIWTPYFFYDDHVLLTHYQISREGLVNFYTTLYRPFLGLGLHLIYDPSATVLHSGAQRFAGVVGLAALMTLVFLWMRKHGYRSKPAAATAALLGTLPAFQSTLGYTTVALATYGGVMSALAIFAIDWGADFARRATSKGRWLLRSMMAMGSAAVCIAVAVGIYPPPSMFCWALVAIAWAAPRSMDWPARRAQFVQLLLACAVGCAMMFLACKFWIERQNLPGSERALLVDGPGTALSMLTWFFSEVVVAAYGRIAAALHQPLAGQAALAPTLTALGLALAFVPCLLRRLPGWPIRHRVELGLLTLALFPLTYLPLLVVQQQYFVTLYMTSLQPAVVLMAVGGVICLVDRLSVVSEERRARWLTGALAATTLVFALACNRNAQQTYVGPNAFEYRFVKERLSRAPLEALQHVHIKGTLNFSDVPLYGERLVRAVLNELGAPQDVRITSSPASGLPVSIDEKMLDRHREILGRAYAWKPDPGLILLAPDLDEELRRELEIFFLTLEEGYHEEGAYVVDVSNTWKVTGRWSGLY